MMLKKFLVLFTLIFVNQPIFSISSLDLLKREKNELVGFTSLVQKAIKRGWTRDQLVNNLLNASREYALQEESAESDERVQEVKKKMVVLSVFVAIAVVVAGSFAALAYYYKHLSKESAEELWQTIRHFQALIRQNEEVNDHNVQFLTRSLQQYQWQFQGVLHEAQNARIENARLQTENNRLQFEMNEQRNNQQPREEAAVNNNDERHDEYVWHVNRLIPRADNVD